MKVVGKVAKGFIKPMVNVSGWMGLEQIKTTSVSMGSWIFSIFKVQKATRKETFEQAVERLNLTEKDITSRKKAYLRYAMIYLIVSLCGCGYTLYLFMNGYFSAGLLTFLVAALFFSKAVVSHFLYFQIKHRKLGCTFKEWFDGRIKETK